MGNLNKAKTFRMREDTYERLEQLDNFSEIFRDMTDLYLNEPFFRNGVDAYSSDKVDSFEAYAEAYFESRAEDISGDLVRRMDEAIDPDEIVEPLRDYLAAVNFGDRNWAEQAAEDFYEVDEALGDFFTSYTLSFSEDQWDDSLQ